MSKIFHISEIDKMFQEIGKDFSAIITGMIDDNQSRTINYAPIDSGALKSSIKVGINQDIVEYDKNNTSYDTTKMANQNTLSQYKLGDTVTITVGAPYGQVIEEGNSTHSPQPYIRPAAEELDHSIQYAKQNIKKYRQS